jgi:hypothetical protein
VEDPMKVMSQKLAEIEQLLEKDDIEWKLGPVPDGDEYETQTYTFSSDGWTLVVASFSIEDQGFPKGSRGHDGLARGDGFVIRLTRELAKLALAKAEVALGSKSDG